MNTNTVNRTGYLNTPKVFERFYFNLFTRAKRCESPEPLASEENVLIYRIYGGTVFLNGEKLYSAQDCQANPQAQIEKLRGTIDEIEELFSVCEVGTEYRFELYEQHESRNWRTYDLIKTEIVPGTTQTLKKIAEESWLWTTTGTTTP